MPQMAAHGSVTPGGVRPVDAAMVPETVGPSVVSVHYPNAPNQFAGRPVGMPDAVGPADGAYPRQQQFFQQNAASSPTFRDVCSPTYQSADAYQQYVRDIMNADG